MVYPVASIEGDQGETQWRTGSGFFTGHDGLKGALLFTNPEGFKYIFAKEALFARFFEGAHRPRANGPVGQSTTAYMIRFLQTIHNLAKRYEDSELKLFSAIYLTFFSSEN